MENNVEFDLRARIQNILRINGYSVSKLAGGYSTTTQTRLNRQINSDTTISACTLIHILGTFPNLSAEWLLRGEGPMNKTDIAGIQAGALNTGNATDGSSITITNKGTGTDASLTAGAIIQAKDELIAHQAEEIQFLKSLVTTLTNQSR